MANQREHQRVGVSKSYNLELEAFHCDSINEYNKYPNTVIGKMKKTFKYFSEKHMYIYKDRNCKHVLFEWQNQITTITRTRITT